jgi:hypothetical protein
MTIVKSDNEQFFMNKTLYNNLSILKKAVLKDNFDFFGIIDGQVGSGKSTLAMQQAKFFDPTFNLDRVHFTGENYAKAVQESEKFQAHVFDEAVEGMSAREHYTFINRTLVKLLTKVRHKGLFNIIVLPSFFDLEKSMAIYRSNCLTHCYLNKMKRGQFTFFAYTNKKNLYVRGKKFMYYGASKANFIGNFGKFFPFNYDVYEKKKVDSYLNIKEKQTTGVRELTWQLRYKQILENLKKLGYNSKDVAKLTGGSYLPPIKATYVRDLAPKLPVILEKQGSGRS